MDASHVYVCALALGCFYSHISTQTFRRVLTASLDSCAEIKSAPVAARFVNKVTKRAAMPARSVSNEVVTNRAGIAPFF